MVAEKRDPPQSGPTLMKGYRPIPGGYDAISERDVFHLFWEHARTEKRVFVVILCSVILQGGVAGGTIYLLKSALDQFFEKQNLTTVAFLVGTLFLATVLKSGFEFLFNWKKAVAVARINDQLVIRAFRHLLWNPFRYHIEERDRKKYAWVLEDAMKFINSIFGMFNAWGKQPFVLFGTVVALWVISPFLTLVGIVLVPLVIPCILFLKRKIKDFVAMRKQLLGVIEEVVSESIRSIRIVKVFGLEERNVAQLASAIDQQRDINMKNAFYLGLMSPLSELIGFIGLAVIVVAGSQRIIDGSFTTGTFFVFIMAFLNIYRPLKDISGGFMNYQLALDAGRRLIILEQRAAEARHNQGSVVLDRFKHLKARDLWFAYNGGERKEAQEEEETDYVLRGLSLDLHAGESVALVGATGAGKSTLCDLICRLYEPTQGQLLINGTPVSDFTKESFTAAFGLCSQETIVFNNALVEEIRVAAPEASPEEVRRVADAVGLSAYMAAGHRNWESWTGDRGVQFSGGQRQMIAIARALLRKPQVLIMDEAMSGLDVETGRLLWRNIRSMLPETAILAISHNWDVIRHCQRVCVMVEGRIAKTMQVAEIEDKDQFFRSLHIDRPGSKRPHD